MAPVQESSHAEAVPLNSGGSTQGKHSSRNSHLPRDARVLIVGAHGVGKSSLSRALRRLASKGGLGELSVAESQGPNLPDLSTFGPELQLILVVWDASQGSTLPAYVDMYAEQLSRYDGKRGVPTRPDQSPARAASGRSEATAAAGAPPSPATQPAFATASVGSAVAMLPLPRLLVVCNKCDSMPCPMPQIKGLQPTQAFIAVSAERGTNLGHLWSMIQPVLARSGRATRGSDTAAAGASGGSGGGGKAAVRGARSRVSRVDASSEAA
jgi:energy-coupling factor transporter ATP-binding protein EcfA2